MRHKRTTLRKHVNAKPIKVKRLRQHISKVISKVTLADHEDEKNDNESVRDCDDGEDADADTDAAEYVKDFAKKVETENLNEVNKFICYVIPLFEMFEII